MYLATLMLLGSGELGREFTIAAKRLGCRVIACDRYDNAPAMQMADASEVFPMLDGEALRNAVEKHRPDVIVPEIEAIDTATLAALEDEGWRVAPSQYVPRASAWMLATWTGANAGASWTTMRPPLARSMTISSSAGIAFHALAGAAATMSFGVSSFFAGAAPISSAAAVASRTKRMRISPV
jgi:hypothetical protein